MYNLYTYDKQMKDKNEKEIKDKKDNLLFNKRHSNLLIIKLI